MARIRSIKPEFPQSESMGNVSRDARLLFVMLWPICDDHGRTRAAPRMLASTLFPYDDDAKSLIGSWLDELEREGCIVRYESSGSTYLEICNWLKHQKIDKPSKPQFPEPSGKSREDYRDFAEPYPLEGNGREGIGEEYTSAKTDSVPSIPNCPHESIVDAYHRLLPELRRVREWNDKRRKALKSRWTESHERQSVEWWEEYFRSVATSDFLMGRTDNPFSCDLEWLVNASNLVKVIEGKYVNKARANGSNGHTASLPAGGGRKEL